MLNRMTLADLQPHKGSARFIRLRAQRALNLGNPTLRTSMDVGTFLGQSVVGNDPKNGEVSQRKLDPDHAQKIAKYIFKALVNYTIDQCKNEGTLIPEEVVHIAGALGTQPYYALAPFVVTLRDGLGDIDIEPLMPGDKTENEFILNLSAGQLLFIDDGQHRGDGYRRVQSFLTQLCSEHKYTKSGGLVPSDLKTVSEEAVVFWRKAFVYFKERFSVSLDIHCGLRLEQERQLFHDTNNLQKTVAASLAQLFDSGNPINLFTARLLNSDDFADVTISEEGKVDWDSKAWMRRDSLNAINARLFLNANSTSGATPDKIQPREDDAWLFWETVTKIPGIFDRNQSVASQPALLKSIARVFFEIKWSNKPEAPEIVTKFLDALPRVDFSHSNTLWDITHMEEEERQKHPRLFNDYLPTNWREKQIAEVKNGTIRFGTKHNESILVLPQIVRYLTNLPPSAIVKTAAMIPPILNQPELLAAVITVPSSPAISGYRA